MVADTFAFGILHNLIKCFACKVTYKWKLITGEYLFFAQVTYYNIAKERTYKCTK